MTVLNLLSTEIWHSFFSSRQRDLYDESFRDLVQAVLDGFNGTIFAYGQTGTGKTFTMQGTSFSEPRVTCDSVLEREVFQIISTVWLFCWYCIWCLCLDLVIHVNLLSVVMWILQIYTIYLLAYDNILLTCKLKLVINLHSFGSGNCCTYLPLIACSSNFLRNSIYCEIMIWFLAAGVKNDPDLKGVIPNSFDHIFSHIARTENQQFLVRASYLEIYMVRTWLSSCIPLPCNL